MNKPRRFKVGQKIRFIKTCSGYNFLNNKTVGIITQLDKNGMYINILNNDNYIKKKKWYSSYLQSEVIGYCFMEDVYDSIEPVKPLWRFWKR